MLEKRLNSGPESVEHIGILPTGEMYVDRKMPGDDMPDFVLTDFLAPGEVVRLKSLLAMGGWMTDEELLDRLAGRFKRGSDLLRWLHASGISTAPRSGEATPDHPPLPSPVSIAGPGERAVSREFVLGTRFYEVEGVPVALEPTQSGPLVVSAVDPARREFPLASVYRNGMEITPSCFDELVASFVPAVPGRRSEHRPSQIKFPADTRFYEVEGVPVALEPAPSGGAVARAFDPAPRYFPVNVVVRNGAEITRDVFDDMVNECLEAQRLENVPTVWPADD